MFKLTRCFSVRVCPSFGQRNLRFTAHGSRAIRRSLWAIGLLVCMAGWQQNLNAQTDFTRIYGAEDQDVLKPHTTGLLGRIDPTALQAVNEYRAIINAPSWQGMQGAGSLTYPAATTNSATLMVLGGTRYRLDTETQQGLRSLRISGGYGVDQDEKGKQSFLQASTAAAGLMAFPRLLSSSFPNVAISSLVDQGMVSVNGRQFQRITLEVPAAGMVLNPLNSSTGGSASSSSPQNQPNSIQKQQDIATDLYFDPSTHLLIKSVDAVLVVGTGSEKYIRAMTYGDYRQVNGSMIPFLYRLTLNGQPEWQLQLNQVEVNTSLTESQFQF